MEYQKKIKQEVIRQLRAVKDGAKSFLACSAIILVPYTALTLAVNAVVIPALAGYNGIERLVGGETKHTTAKLVNKGEYNLPSNGGVIYWGEFQAALDEKPKRLVDTADIVTGKFLPNWQLRDAKVGQEYQVTSLEGPISDKLLELK